MVWPTYLSTVSLSSSEVISMNTSSCGNLEEHTRIYIYMKNSLVFGCCWVVAVFIFSSLCFIFYVQDLFGATVKVTCIRDKTQAREDDNHHTAATKNQLILHIFPVKTSIIQNIYTELKIRRLQDLNIR